MPVLVVTMMKRSTDDKIKVSRHDLTNPTTKAEIKVDTPVIVMLTF
jgi:hypothetical protein